MHRTAHGRLTAPDRPNAPPELARAPRTIDRIVAQRLTDARVPSTTAN
jgi:hypothetical protein